MIALLMDYYIIPVVSWRIRKKKAPKENNKNIPTIKSSSIKKPRIVPVNETTKTKNGINLRVRRNTRSYTGHQFFLTVLLTILSHFSQ